MTTTPHKVYLVCSQCGNSHSSGIYCSNCGYLMINVPKGDDL